MAAIRALIQARVLLADGAPAAARAVLAGLREGPPPGLRRAVPRGGRRRRKPRCGSATSAVPVRCCGLAAQAPAGQAPAARTLAAAGRALAAAGRALAAAN